MKILLHTCCAPCLLYPYQVLRSKGYEVIAYFYNPNIHPFSEYKKRLAATRDYVKKHSIELIVFADYDIESFFHAIHNREEEPQRCHKCWKMRLIKVARKAKELGHDAFSTTLLVSPYQDIERIKEIGKDIAKNEDIEFYFEDWRGGFKEAHDKAREAGLYMQKYCGCLYSERTRYIKKYRKKDESLSNNI